MKNFKKHKILKTFQSKWDYGEQNSGFGLDYTEIGRSLTTIELSKNLKYDLKTVETLCNTLQTSNHIKLLLSDNENKVYRYVITPSGHSAVTDKFYLNKLWYRDYKFWAFLCSLGVLIFGAIRYYKDHQ